MHVCVGLFATIHLRLALSSLGRWYAVQFIRWHSASTVLQMYIDSTDMIAGRSRYTSLQTVGVAEALMSLCKNTGRI